MYGTFLLDPPWPERGGGKIKRGADRHYPLIKVPDMPPVIFGSGMFQPAENAHLYCWVTNNYLPAGMRLVEILGFRYLTLLTWPKERFGLGQYFRGATEHVIFAVRGKGKDPSVCTEAKNLTTLLNFPQDKKHSRKPLEFYDVIEARSKGPYLEMFARQRRKGWDAWGDELSPTLSLSQVEPGDPWDSAAELARQYDGNEEEAS